MKTTVIETTTTETDSTLALPVEAPTRRRGEKHSAARRAYQRRQRRAAILEGGSTQRLVRRRTGEFAARIPFVIATASLLTLGLVLTLLLSTRAAEDSYALSAAKHQNVRLGEQRDALAREVQLAESAPELAAAARKLGMIPAVDPAKLVVAQDGSVEVVGKLAPAAGAPVAPLNNRPGKMLLGSPAAMNQAPDVDRVVSVTPQRNSTTPAAPAPSVAAVPAPPATANTQSANPAQAAPAPAQSTPMTVQVQQMPGGPR